jgi:hypothetical protein
LQREEPHTTPRAVSEAPLPAAEVTRVRTYPCMPVDIEVHVQRSEAQGVVSKRGHRERTKYIWRRRTVCVCVNKNGERTRRCGCERMGE